LDSAQQQTLHIAADGSHPAQQCRPRNPARATISANSARIIAWASGSWRAIVLSVIPGGMPRLLPNTTFRVQISLPKNSRQTVNA
jgi:hypothetical protein